VGVSVRGVGLKWACLWMGQGSWANGRSKSGGDVGSGRQ
jgi:hypothetical protein